MIYYHKEYMKANLQVKFCRRILLLNLGIEEVHVLLFANHFRLTLGIPGWPRMRYLLKIIQNKYQRHQSLCKMECHTKLLKKRFSEKKEKYRLLLNLNLMYMVRKWAHMTIILKQTRSILHN